MPALLKRVDLAIQSQIDNPDVMRAVVVCLDCLMMLPEPDVFPIAMEFDLRVFSGCQDAIVRREAARVARDAARRNTKQLRANLVAFRELIVMIAAAIPTESCLAVTVTMAIDTMAAMMNVISQDPEERKELVRLWNSLVGNVTDFVDDRETLHAAVKMAQSLIEIFPDEMTEGLSRSGGTFGLVHSRLFERFAESKQANLGE
jgi:hypothetical protein